MLSGIVKRSCGSKVNDSPGVVSLTIPRSRCKEKESATTVPFTLSRSLPTVVLSPEAKIAFPDALVAI